MKTIAVKYTPDFMNAAAVSIFIVWIVLTVVICSVMDQFLAVLLLLVNLFGMIGICFYLDGIKTIVEYDTEKIHWKWLWFSYTVHFNEMESVYYTITTQRTRYDDIRRFEIRFCIKDNEMKLNDLIQTEDIENCIHGKADEMQLMQLYKFIENVCPEKSKGFVKTS